MQASAIKKCIYEKKAYQPAVITITPPGAEPGFDHWGGQAMIGGATVLPQAAAGVSSIFNNGAIMVLRDH